MCARQLSPALISSWFERPTQSPIWRLKHEALRRLYLDIGDLADCAADDPRLPALADRVAAFIEAAAAEAGAVEEEPPVSEDLVALLDAAFIEFFPCAPRLFELLEERGWTGWTNIRRIDAADCLEVVSEALG